MNFATFKNVFLDLHSDNIYGGKFTSKSHAGKITHRRKCEGACSISLQAFFLTQHEIHNSFEGGLKTEVALNSLE